ncbi:HdeD family acid-resistance protein [Leifsonia sp. NPDC058230]|uniref:HdeD family acid-resistance protein n=1 Tax=Leifsonia sp. NPDC058230 TaxID=3346391 RepID=UPI0036DB422F
MTSSDPIDAVLNDFSLDAKNLTRSAINGVRAALGISGAVAVILGIVLIVWPVKTLAVLAIFLGIYFVVAGVMRLALGIFSKGISGGMRTLNIVLGVLLVIAGIVALKNVTAAATTLIIFAIAFIGIGWIIEGVMSIAESSRASSSGWAIASGIISILAGIVVLFLPASSAVFLVFFAAAALIVLGAIGIWRAFTFGRDVLKATSGAPVTA